MPLHETAPQGAIFLSFLYAGLLTGLAGDLLSPLTRRRQLLLRGLGDLLLCACASGLCFFVLYLHHCDKIRLYMVLALGLGWGIHRFGVHALIAGLGKFLLPDRKKRKGSE